jgi:phospholipase A1
MLKSPCPFATVILVVGVTHGVAAHAQLATCAAIVADSARLACYDALARGEPRELLESPAARAPASASASAPPQASAPTDVEKQWELRPELKRGIFRLLPHRPIYALVHATSDVNNDPHSPTRALDPAAAIDLQPVEAKLQLGFKTKLAQDVLGSPADLWFGYTQQSYWQAANRRNSSIFRETNYSPEAILLYPLDLAIGGTHVRYAAVSLVHKSNGRGVTLSRSWNRLIGEAAVETGPWSLQVRPWARVFKPSGDDDDNPDIEDFVGRGELVAVYRNGPQVVTLTGRHTLRGGDRSRGSIQVDWAFPLLGSMNGHVQAFTGYGESLIDYNHRQTTIGVGVSFFD